MTDPSLLSAAEMLAAMETGRLSSEEICAACLDRIEALNPRLNAITALRPRNQILAEARATDQARRQGKGYGALFGLPHAVKDLIETAGIPTSWGSPIYRDHVPAKDGLVAARLRAAGAILIGKTNVPEFGLGSHSFNPVYGTTLNPWDPGRSAGGSSGGAAVALAARMLPLADGSDMMGSLRNPAGWNNIYSLRPSWGLVPSDRGGDQFMATLATDGPMARNMRDLAILLGVMAGPAPGLPFPVPVADYRAAIDAPPRPAADRPLRIGWLGDWGGAYGCEAGITALCTDTLGQMQDLMGVEIITLPPPFPAERLWQAWTRLRAFLNAGGRRDLANDPASWAQLKPEMQWEIAQGRSLTLDQLHEASVMRSDWYAAAADLFEKVDFLALPTAQVWPFPADWRHPESIEGRAMDTYHRWMEVVIPASLAGLPTLTVPAGFGGPGGNLPMGLQLIAPFGQDVSLLHFGAGWNRIESFSTRMPPEVAA